MNTFIQEWASSLGITAPINGSWIQAIAKYYNLSLPVSGSWEEAISVHLGQTTPVNGSWIQAIAFALGKTTLINNNWIQTIYEGATTTTTTTLPPLDVYRTGLYAWFDFNNNTSWTGATTSIIDLSGNNRNSTIGSDLIAGTESSYRFITGPSSGYNRVNQRINTPAGSTFSNGSVVILAKLDTTTTMVWLNDGAGGYVAQQASGNFYWGEGLSLNSSIKNSTLSSSILTAAENWTLLTFNGSFTTGLTIGGYEQDFFGFRSGIKIGAVMIYDSPLDTTAAAQNVAYYNQFITID